MTYRKCLPGWQNLIQNLVVRGQPKFKKSGALIYLISLFFPFIFVTILIYKILNDPLKNIRIRPPLKKSLFPVQQVAIIMASQEAAKSSFFLNLIFLCIKMVEKMLGKKKSGNMKKMWLPGPYRVTRPVDRKQNYF